MGGKQGGPGFLSSSRHGPPLRAGGSVRGPWPPSVYPGPLGALSPARCPPVSLTPAYIFVTSELKGVPQLWAQVWGQRWLSLPGPGGSIRAHSRHHLPLPRSVPTRVQVVDHLGPLGGVLGSQMGILGRETAFNTGGWLVGWLDVWGWGQWLCMRWKRDGGLS